MTGCIVACAVAATPARAQDAPGSILRRYLDARWKGDVAAAEALWDAGDLRRSQALGTRYPGLEARHDDNLWWTAEARAAARAVRPIVLDSTLAADSGTFTVAAGTDTLRWGVRRTAGEWRVTSAFDVVTRGFTAREGRFVRLHAARLRDVNADALVALDHAVESMLQRLGGAEQVRLRLERLKIEYALCATAADVGAICGSRPAGHRPAGERIVTRETADLAALASVVLRLAARDLPPHLLPLLGEGTAAALGGQPGVAAEVVCLEGASRVAAGTRAAEAVLDPAAYAAMPRAERVPVAAVWSAALLRALGADKYLALVRDLSTAGDPASAFNAAAVRGRFETATGKRGPALADWLRAQAATTPAAITAGYGERMPVQTRTVRPFLGWRDMRERWALEAYEVGDEYVFLLQPYAGPVPLWAQRVADSLAVARGEKPPVRAATARPPGDPPQVAMTFRRRTYGDPEAYESRLYLEQFRQKRYAGELFGLFIGVDAVRVWDYRRDTLIAAIEPETTPQESRRLYDEPAGRIAFRVRRDLFPQPLLEYVATNSVYTGE